MILRCQTMPKLILCKHEWLEKGTFVPGQQIFQAEHTSISNKVNIHHGMIISVDNHLQKSYVLWKTVPENILIWSSVIVQRFDIEHDNKLSRKLDTTWTSTCYEQG